MYTVGALIQYLQLYDDTLPINDILQDECLMTYLNQIVDLWPTQSRAVVSRLLHRSKRSRGSSRQSTSRQSIPAREALRAIMRVRNVGLPPSLCSQYRSWQRDPSAFWKSQGVCLSTSNLPDLYWGMKRFEVQRQSGMVMWRYFTLFFYDLMLLVGDGKKYMVESLQKRIIGTIGSSGMLHTSAQDIQADLKRWASAGAKYFNIAAKLGNGALILLPQDVTENIWENRLPMKGDCFDQAMTHLLNLGIYQIADEIGANVLGSTIRKMVLRHFQATASSAEITPQATLNQGEYLHIAVETQHVPLVANGHTPQVPNTASSDLGHEQ